ncbi:Hydantoinase/oxoprolinase [Agrocybe pediades]|nr:Hydantoinase/oxoprolinase [Agrocybe pediades]
MNQKSFYRIGVDVGGTNTDAVVIDASKSNDKETRGVVASFKHATTSDVTTGIELAVKKVLEDAGIDPGYEGILSLTIGTTHFINAVVQLDSARLEKVAVIRLAAPYTTECPPFIDFPIDLKNIMCGHTAIIHGGLQIDGRTINELREEEVVQQARIIQEKGLKNVVIIGIYSPLDVNGKQEYRAREILKRELGTAVNIVCSCDVGHVGFMERENASILNASIMSFAKRTVRGYRRAMTRLGLNCPLYLTQNDGTLITAAEAARLPIKTFSSGATNSMRGASYLAAIDLQRNDSGKSMIVVDIGGTTTDVGVLLPSGFPRQAAAFIEVAGVRTNFSMPDIHSIGLGGGSRIRTSENGKISVGPDSVGHFLPQEALVFGGETLTATDVMVRLGVVKLGDPALAEQLAKETAENARETIKRMLEIVVDRMKTSQEDCDLLLVGGGSIIAPPSLRGVKNIILPRFHEVANAVGAAIASVSGEIDTIEILHGKSLSSAIERIKQQAVDNAVQTGADRASTRIVDINVLPVQYVTNQATRIIVRAVGDLDFSSTVGMALEDVEEIEDEAQPHSIINPPSAKEEVDFTTYRPNIVGKEWILSETDLFFIMEGCGVLGTGGGGSPYPAYLICRQILRDGGSIRIIDHSSLRDEDVVVRGGFMGSPSVGSERIRSGEHLRVAGRELAKYCGISNFSATLCDEIGGSNGMQSLQMSKYYDIPALDGDLMGRAYPMLDQVLPAVYDKPNSLVPCSLNDGSGNTVLLTTVKNDHFVESIMRVVTTEMGSSAALCPPPLAVCDARDFGVTRTQSQAWRIGRAIAICRQLNNLKGVTDEILKLQNGRCLFIGKIINVSREVRAGFTWGEVRIARLRNDELEDATDTNTPTDGGEEDATMLIPFQNENLCAYLDFADGRRKVEASVPDLITILDSQSGSHLGTPEYTYGLRVTVLALAGHPLWRSEKGLKRGGPPAFGLTHTFSPIGDYIEPRSVIEEYSS